MASAKTLLITGANRGVGRAIADTYLARPNITLIALVRDPSHESAASLSTQPTGANSVAIVIPYDASSTTSADSAIATLQSQHPGITHIDTVIANAGFSGYTGPSISADADTYISHYIVNALSPLLLLRACLPLLDNSGEEQASFIAISSGAGSTARISDSSRLLDTSGKPRDGALPYTSTKCALNHVMCKLNGEHLDIKMGLFTPGPTRTGFGSGRFDFDKIPGLTDVDTVVKGLVKQFDELKKTGVYDGGEGKGNEERFVLRDWKGEEIAW